MLRKFLLARTLLVLGLILAGSLALLAAPERPWPALARQKGDDTGSGRKEEEEDDKPTKPKKKDISRFEDPEEKEKGKEKDKDRPPPPVVTVPTGDLRQAARDARHEHVKSLYGELATEHDVVKFKGAKHVTANGRKLTAEPVWVEPIAEYRANPRELKGQVTFHLLDEKTHKRTDEVKAGGGAIESLRYYEQLAGDRVEEFLKQDFASAFAPDHKLYLTKYNQLLAAEVVLARVVAFHESARKRGVRKGDEWDEVEDKLRGQLLDVLLKQITELTAATSWDAAFALSERVIKTFPSAAQHAKIAGPLADLLKKSLNDTKASSGARSRLRQRLEQMEEKFPKSDAITEIGKSLRQQAGLLAKEAEGKKKTDKKEALRLVKQAQEIWPQFPGLSALRRELEDAYPVLRVGVRTLPQYYSPGWAITDSEQRVVELLFESLVELVPDKYGTLYYQPVLAVGRPRVVALGRELRLPRGAKWSDGKHLDLNDIRHTLGRLKGASGDKRDGDTAYRCKVTGRCVAWGDLLAGLNMEGDSTRMKLQLGRGLLDPLGAMSFKVLPVRSRPDPASKAFATNPISSGPFQYHEVATEEGKGRYIGFKANPHYGSRVGRVGLPKLSEVRLFELPADKDKAASDFVKDAAEKLDLDLVLDLTAEQAAAFIKEEGWEVPLPKATTPNRRVSFLAVNHRGGASNPLTDADVRIALARAIDREALLDEHFRKGLEATPKLHRALNGPYPAGSWACDPKLAGETTADPHDAALARAKLREGLKRLNKKAIHLTVKYPSGDPRLKAAIEDLCARVTKTCEQQLVLTAKERTPEELRQEVEVTHDYDLAYYSYDYPDESLWLFPLLGPSARGGSENFLGYNGVLVRKALQAAALRDITQVRDHARQLHRQFLQDEMPLVPLWQLDPLYAYRKEARRELVLPPIDPQKVFTRVQEWYVKRK